ncbi:MAG: sodium/proline symporter PutP [Lentisphaeria bacterium]
MFITFTMFALYLVLLIGIGIYFFERKSNVEKYLLGGRGLGSWVTAMSAQASDMSGWLLMGLPGSVYMLGIGEAWVAIGLAVGTILNWLLVAKRLRIMTELTSSLTVSSYIGKRFKDPTGIISSLAAIIIFVFFTIYAGSCMVAAGKLFESIFGMNYTTAVIVGGAVILFYTLCGGYMAVCWTDLIQGVLMFIAVIVVPLLAVSHMGDISIADAFSARNIPLSILPKKFDFAALLAIISTSAWGLGYFGQPHIIVRFMGITSHKAVKKATIIAIIWVVVSLAAAIFIGAISVALYQQPVLSANDSERVFIQMIAQFCNPWFGGIFLAAIMAAIMSTIDSQLLAASSSVSEDIYKKLFRRHADQRELMLVNRILILVIALLAMIMATMNFSTIFKIVSFAWGGFGAAFGPIILFSLYSRKMTWQAALAGMITGTAAMLIWKYCPWGHYMYEILPGFIVNTITIFICTALKPQDNPEILAQYDKMLTILQEK